MTLGQRAAKRQPAGGLMRLGGRPEMPERCVAIADAGQGLNQHLRVRDAGDY